MSEKNPAVTIAVPSYNHGRYVGQAIRSLFEQSYRDFEIVIIDDGSPDNSLEVIQRRLRENPGVSVRFETQENRGLSVTLNRALTMARGEYFGFLPSDDFFHPRKLEQQMRLLRKHPSLAGCFTWQEVVDAQGNPTTDQAILDWFDLNYVTSFNFFPLLLERNFLVTPSALMRTKLIIDSGGFDESLVYLQDHDLWLRLLSAHEAVVLHERLLYYRWHGENLTASETPRSREEKRYLLQKFVRSSRPGSRRVLENRDRMRSHLAASRVDSVEELLAEFDRFTDPGRTEPVSDIPVCAPLAEEAPLREQLKLVEEQAADARKELNRLTYELKETGRRRKELEAEGTRLRDENETLQSLVAQERQAREENAQLISTVHTLRGSRSYKLIRLAQIFRHGVLTLDPARWRGFLSWFRARMAGGHEPFVLRPDPLAVIERMSANPATAAPAPLPAPIIRIEGETRPTSAQAADSAAFWLMERALPLVSVLLPVYNQADLLSGAIESVLAQDYPNIELIVLDDGSTDDIEPVLSHYAAYPCVRVYRQQNQGLPCALTQLHGLYRGEFVTWTSADNVLEPPMVSALLRTLVANPEAVMAYGDTALIDDKGGPYLKGDYRRQNVDRVSPDVMRLHRDDDYLGAEPDNYINAAFLYRRKASKALGDTYDSRLPGLEDYDFWLRMRKAGPLKHARNREAIYRYRVHENTISQRLFDQEGAAHNERTFILMEAETSREGLANRRWSARFHPDLADEDRKAIAKACQTLPMDLIEDSSGREAKLLTLAPENWSGDSYASGPGAIALVSSNDYELALYESGVLKRTGLRVPRGISVSPLARKARQWVPSAEQSMAQEAKGRPVVGVHLPGWITELDASRLETVMKSLPQLFFMWLAESEAAAQPLRNLASGTGNMGFAGVKPFGQAYQSYAAWDVVWSPPLTMDKAARARTVRMNKTLAFSIARWLFYTDTPDLDEWSPFAIPWFPEEEGYPELLSSADRALDSEVLDRYIEHWSPPGRMKETLGYAEALMQDRTPSAIDRLGSVQNAGTERGGQATARPWPGNSESKIGGAILLQVETLGHGGMEHFVAHLAQTLHERGRDVAVLCARAAGPMAGEIERKGIPVYYAEGDLKRYRSIVREVAPVVLNTQYSPFGLDEASRLGVPLVATIQNMYVWYGEEDWEKEREAYRAVDHYIAVSAMARDYYCRRMGEAYRDSFSVAPNCYDPDHEVRISRETARKRIGLADDDFLILCLATYDGRKNQLGLLSAFDRAAEREADLRLLCAGPVGSADYFQMTRDLKDRLRSGGRIELREFEKNVDTLLAAADVHVTPSYFEGWSLSATEALHAGLPLIHTLCGSALELCGSTGERGIVIDNPGGDPIAMDQPTLYRLIYEAEPPNTDELARAMLEMRRRRDEWLGRRRSLSNYCRRLFSAHAVTAVYEQVFASVIRCKNRV